MDFLSLLRHPRDHQLQTPSLPENAAHYVMTSEQFAILMNDFFDLRSCGYSGFVGVVATLAPFCSGWAWYFHMKSKQNALTAETWLCIRPWIAFFALKILHSLLPPESYHPRIRCFNNEKNLSGTAHYVTGCAKTSAIGRSWEFGDAKIPSFPLSWLTCGFKITWLAFSLLHMVAAARVYI